jgi:hypothetical protein
MLDFLAQILGTTIEARDLIAFTAVLVSVIAFVAKLNADSRTARYRETVAFIEKREADMRKRWKEISRGNVIGAAMEEELYVFLGQLELVSLLIRKNVFDAELVYNYWWRYYDEPLQNPIINSWVQLNRESDSALYEHYLAQCKRWGNRLDKEIGRPRRSVWQKLRAR